MAIYVPIVMYGLRLFIVVLQELYYLLRCLYICMIRGVYIFVRGFSHFIKSHCSIPSSF